MDLREIQALIKFVSQNSVDEVEINRKDFKLLIKKNPAQVTTAVVSAPTMVAAPVAAQAPAAISATAPAVAAAPVAPAANNYIEIKSPMVGTFYRASNPETPNFVNVGDEVAPGKVVCIIEAMKLFNEIESDIKGKIVKVLVDNATPVEYDQPLFLVEPA
jgi:acetyl-CoA carboxylase biotin carboxyl carrier protein